MTERDRPKGVKGDEDHGFLQRWSRRKAEARSAATTATEAPSGPVDHAAASREQPPEPEQGAEAPLAPEDLPDIESLDASSDFTVFMRPGVPEHLRTLALRKLWRSDPVFSKLDGLVEYGEDYSLASWPKEAIKTAYKVGRGFLEEIREGGDGPDQASPTEPPAPSAEPSAEEPAAQPARIAAAEAEVPEEPASRREPDSPQQGSSPMPIKRRRTRQAKLRP